MRVLFKSWDSKMASREKLFKAATEFATKLGEERLINITHSEDRDNIVITLWYWGEKEEQEEKVAKKDTIKIRPVPSPLPAPPVPGNKTDVAVTQSAGVVGPILGPEEKEEDLGQTPPLEKTSPMPIERPLPKFEINEDNW